MKKATRGLATSVAVVVLAAATLVAFSGCGGCRSQTEYPAGFVFPPRADRLVLQLPDKPAPAINTAGKRDEEIGLLDSLGGRTLDPVATPAHSRTALDAFLKTAFGTPAEPNDVSAPLKLTKDHLSEGARLYKRHCLDCHNLTGDGRGAKSGLYVVPFPRDYRQGAFKFVTSGEGMKPRRSDLLRTLHDGLKGTAMPSFALLQEGERDLLAGYVIFLSLRGQVEFDSLRAAASGAPPSPDASFKNALAEWEKAEAAPPLPAPPDDGEPTSPAHQAAVSRGHALFIEKAENSCVSCHGDYGRKPVLRYDVWGTVAKPIDFTQTSFKGGSRPEDVYARVRFGIAAVGMPAHGPPKYTERQVWDLVRFVSALPYQDRLPPDVRAAVHPNP